MLALTAHVNLVGLKMYRPLVMQGRSDALSMQRKAVGQQTQRSSGAPSGETAFSDLPPAPHHHNLCKARHPPSTCKSPSGICVGSQGASEVVCTLLHDGRPLRHCSLGAAAGYKSGRDQQQSARKPCCAANHPVSPDAPLQAPCGISLAP
jgi:hypothetical protein